MITHQAPDGFKDLRSEIAPNLPKAFKAFERLTNRPFEFANLVEKDWAMDEMKRFGFYLMRTVGGFVAFIHPFGVDRKKHYLIVSMQSMMDPVNCPLRGWHVPVHHLDIQALARSLMPDIQGGDGKSEEHGRSAAWPRPSAPKESIRG